MDVGLSQDQARSLPLMELSEWVASSKSAVCGEMRVRMQKGTLQTSTVSSMLHYACL